MKLGTKISAERAARERAHRLCRADVLNSVRMRIRLDYLDATRQHQEPSECGYDLHSRRSTCEKEVIESPRRFGSAGKRDAEKGVPPNLRV
jgi:hypothetical protein